MNKYHNRKIVIDGHKFDSQKEGKRYVELKLMARAGMISQLEIQKSFILLDGYIKNGKTIRPITYKADFVYFDEFKKKMIVEDTKGFRTEVYKLKKKMFEAKYKEMEIKEL